MNNQLHLDLDDTPPTHRAMTNAERQKRYRDKRGKTISVTINEDLHRQVCAYLMRRQSDRDPNCTMATIVAEALTRCYLRTR